MRIVKFKRCNHEWPTRLEQPVRCAKCRSPYWTSEPKRATIGVGGSDGREVLADASRKLPKLRSRVREVSPSDEPNPALDRRVCPHGKEPGRFCFDCRGTVK